MQPRAVGGIGLDAQWNDDVHHALHAVLTGERDGYYRDFATLADLARALERGFVYDGRYSVYRGRRHGRAASGISGHRLVGYWQNHEQIGNRVRGRRSGHLVSPERLAVGAALVPTAPFVPLLFQGEEWGASAPFLYCTSHEDPTLGAAVREGRRREFAAFGWDPDEMPDPQALETFERSKLDWRELERESHASLLAWHRGLIDLRRAWPALTAGRRDAVRVLVDEAARWLVVDRGPVTVACNQAAEPQLVPVSMGARRLALTSQPDARTTTTGVTLPSDAVVILAPERGL